MLGWKKISSHTHKAGSWYLCLLQDLFKISTEYPVSFICESPLVSVLFGEFSSCSITIEAILCFFFPSASEGLLHIADCLFTHMCHSFPIPSTISQDLLSRIVQEVLVRWYGKFSYPTIQESAKVGIGFLISEIWEVRCRRNPLFETTSRCLTIAMLVWEWRENRRATCRVEWGNIFLYQDFH